MIRLSKSAFHYRRQPRQRVAQPVPHRERCHPARLTADEDAQVVGLLRGSRQSTTQTYYTHLDAGDYVASLSTFHRIARRDAIEMARTGSTRRRHRGPAAPTPRLSATAAGQVACWDISFLPGKYRGQNYALYLVIDLFSRFVLGWTVQEREDEFIATELIEQVISSVANLETLHSDNGSAMTSDRMKQTLANAGIAQSLIRPGVSNDNAQVESCFRTVKYGPHWPGVFDSLDHANDWIAQFVEEYNQQNRHSSLAGFTPAQVFEGTWPQAAQARQDTLEKAYRANPQRYRRSPLVKIPPQRVTLNLVNGNGRTHSPPTITELLTA